MSQLPYLHGTLINLNAVESFQRLHSAIGFDEDNRDNPAHDTIRSVGKVHTPNRSNSVAEVFLRFGKATSLVNRPPSSTRDSSQKFSRIRQMLVTQTQSGNPRQADRSKRPRQPDEHQ